MQEHRHDGTNPVTPNVLREIFDAALADPRNKAVTLHKPGSMIVKDDGTRWIVKYDGTLREAAAWEVP